MAIALAQRYVSWLGLALMAVAVAFAAFEATTLLTGIVLLAGLAIRVAHEYAKDRVEEDEDVKLDAWMWWTIAFGTLVGMVVTFFLVRAVANPF